MTANLLLGFLSGLATFPLLRFLRGLFRETMNEPCDESAYGDRPHVPRSYPFNTRGE